MDLAKLVPGVAELDPSTGTQSNGLAINGLRANQIGFFIDGVDIRTETSGKPAFTPSIEAIQEFRIQENDFSAESGRDPVAINLTLRPGTNAFHGSLFEFLRNNDLDARSFFSPSVNSLRRNQFGAWSLMTRLSGTRRSSWRTMRDCGRHSLPLCIAAYRRLTNVRGTSRAALRFSIRQHTIQPPIHGSPFPATSARRRASALSGPSSLKYYPSPNFSSGSFNYITDTANLGQQRRSIPYTNRPPDLRQGPPVWPLLL